MKRLLIVTLTIIALCNLATTASAQSDPATIPQSEWAFPTVYNKYKQLKTIDGANYFLDTTNKLADFIGFPEVNNDTEYTIPASVEYNGETYTVVAVCYNGNSYASNDGGSSKASTCVNLTLAAPVRYVNLYQLNLLFPKAKEITMSEQLETLYRTFDTKTCKTLNFTSPTPPQYKSPGLNYDIKLLRVNIPDGTFDAYNTMLTTAWSSNMSKVAIIDGGKLTLNVNDFHINVPEPGKLSDEIKSYIGSTANIYGLTINGTINTADFTTLRSCTKLLRLDLSNAVCQNDVLLSNMGLLEELQLPKNISQLNKQALQNCSSLKRLTLPEGLTTLAEYALDGCTSLKEIDIPASLVTIKNYAFRNCSSLTSITLPADMETLGTNVFNGCSSLQSITIPEKITEIPNEVFSNCTSLSNVQFASQTTSIGNSAFVNTKLTELTLPETLQEIGKYAFQDCSALHTIHFNPSLKAIRQYAFSGCTALLAVDIPDNVTELEMETFSGCKALTDVRIGKNITTICSGTFKLTAALQNVTLPEGIRTIESSAFYGSGLKNITLPSTVCYIGASALSDCKALQNITCLSLLPPEVIASTFEGELGKIALSVPALSVLSYQSHPIWGDAYAVTPNNTLPQQINISGKTTLSIPDPTVIPEETASAYNPNMRLFHDGFDASFVCDFDQSHTKSYGQLTIDEGTTFNVGTLEYQVGNRELYPNATTDFYTTLINRGYMHVDKTIANITLVGEKKWHFISLPFNTKVTDNILYPEKVNVALRRHDGVARGGGRTEWTNIEIGEYIRAGEPIAVYFDSKTTTAINTLDLSFLSTDNKTAYWSNEDKTVKLNQYQSMLACDADWNFVGNPYPSYYDIYYLRSAQPIITWNGTNYTAYSPLDDRYIINPGEGFFIQRSESTPQLTFDKEGRQHCSHLRNNAMAGAKSLYGNSITTDALNQRHVYDIQLTSEGSQTTSEGQSLTDRTRIVFNALASEDYEPGCDAPKFAAMSSDVPQISTYKQHDGITVNYAINERPATSEPINLKLSVPADGNYKLCVSGKRHAQTNGITLVDRELGTSTPLQTDAEAEDGSVSVTLPLLAGNYAKRFAIVFDSEETTGANTVNVNDASTAPDVYNIAGQRLSAPRKGINIKQNRKYIIK